jgi:hypothetical protein
MSIFNGDIDRIVQRFFPFSIDKYPQRILSLQYMERNKEVYGKDSLSGFDFKMTNDTKDTYFKYLLNKFVGVGAFFNDLENSVSISSLNSTSDYTCTFSYNSDQIVLFDMNTMLFVWMSNKILLYGQELSIDEQYNLFLKTFKYFMLKREFGETALVEYIKPKMPEYPSYNAFRVLVKFQQIQESFMLAHELAHIKVLPDDITTVINMFESDPIVQTLSEIYLKTDDDIYKFYSEVAADNIALTATLNEYRKDHKFDSDTEDKALFEFITSAILILFRYELWLNIAMNTWLNNDNDTGLWALRAQVIRALIDKNNIWNDSSYIVRILEIMENAFEPAALDVPSLLNYILSQPDVEKELRRPL